MAKASISRAWEEARGILGKEARTLTTVALALLVLPSIIIGTLSPGALSGAQSADVTTLILMVVAGVIGLVARITLARIAIGPRTTLGAVMRLALQRSVAALLAFLLFMIPAALLVGPFLLQVIRNPQQPPPGPSLAFLVLSIVAFVVGVRLLILVIPAAAAETSGPVALLRQSWQRTRGNWWRLIGFVLLFVIGSTIAATVVQWILGGVLLVAGGEIEPMTFSALVLSAALAVVGALFAVIFAVMVARIYLQLAGGTRDQLVEPSVPNSGT